MDKDGKESGNYKAKLFLVILCFSIIFRGFVLMLLPLIIAIIGFFIAKENRFWISIGIIISQIYLYIDLKEKWVFSSILYCPDDGSGGFPVLLYVFEKFNIYINVICFLLAVFFIIQSYRERNY